jgi:transcription elongation factor SPT6
MINRIKEAINFMRNQRLEVPFIAFYRKEYVEPELNIKDLWKVWQYDEKVGTIFFKVKCTGTCAL